MKLSMMIILGLAGAEGSERHALATAKAINIIKPTHLSALCLMLYDIEEGGAVPPEPSDVRSIVCAENQLVTLIRCDTIEYRKFFDNRAVKKTLTIPAWLNTMAERQGVNFSMILQNALKAELHI